jgi:hypothetical protein
MKKVFLIISIIILTPLAAFSQEDCTVTLKNETKAVDICDFCGTGCADGVLNSLTIDSDGKAAQINFSSDLTITNDITIDPKNGDSFFIPTGVTVTIEGDLNFIGNSAPKNFTVNGSLNVTGQIDLENQKIEINGSGTISADRIINGDASSCGADNDCPSFNVANCDDTSGLCTETALPIELKSFTASKSNSNINLDWVTAKEENFSHFEIERSVDQENWEQIGLVQGMGESMSDVHYDFTDRNAPFGIIYYRLNAVDIDASFEYSPVVKVEVGFEGKLAVSPNPVRDASNLKIQVPTEFTENLAYVALFDLSGIKVQEFRNFDTNGTLQIDQKLKSGMYILKVNHNGLQENIRVIIQ